MKCIVMDDAVIWKEDNVIVKDNGKTEDGVMDVNYDDAAGMPIEMKAADEISRFWKKLPPRRIHRTSS
jgi:hypothetical protein